MSDVRKDIEAIKAVLADAPGPYEIGRDDWLVAYRLSTGPERILRLIEAITTPQAQRDAAQPAGVVRVQDTGAPRGERNYWTVEVNGKAVFGAWKKASVVELAKALSEALAPHPEGPKP